MRNVPISHNPMMVISRIDEYTITATLALLPLTWQRAQNHGAVGRVVWQKATEDAVDGVREGKQTLARGREGMLHACTEGE